MAIELINIGYIANDGTGDDLREAFIKVNQNFEELDLRITGDVTASNIEGEGEGIFSQKLIYDLQFKKLVSGSNVVLESSDSAITISVPNENLANITISADENYINLTANSELKIVGGDGIKTKIEGDYLVIDNTVSKLETDPFPKLSNSLNAQGHNFYTVGIIDAARVTGSFYGTLNGSDFSQYSAYFENMEFGDIYPKFNTTIEWLAHESTIDMGTFESPSLAIIDFGQV